MKTITWDGTWPHTLDWLLDAAAKGSFIALFGGFLVWMWSRRAAADRYRVWLGVVLALACLPLLGALLPSHVLPLASNPPSQTELTADIISAPVSEPAPQLFDTWLANAKPAQAATKTAVESPIAIGWFHLYLLGAGFVCLRLLISAAALWRVRKRSRKADLTFQARIDELGDTLGIRRKICLLLSSARQMPMTWGIWRPKLLLPMDATTWDEDRLDAVLLHELAHIQRYDNGVQLLSQLVLAVYWFNPIVWFVNKRLAVERERACDDAVVSQGTKPSDYATHLMGLSTGREFSPLWATAMANPTQLESRLKRVLDPSCKRQGMSAVVSCTLLMTVFILTLSLTSVKLTAAESPAPIPPKAMALLKEALALMESAREKDADVPVGFDISGETITPIYEKDRIRPLRPALRGTPTSSDAILESLEPAPTEIEPPADAIDDLLPEDPSDLPDLVEARTAPPANIPKLESVPNEAYQEALRRYHQLKTQYTEDSMPVMKQRALLHQLEAERRSAPTVTRVATPQSGIVRNVTVRSGESVERGQVLMQLDRRLAELSLDEAKGKIQAAEQLISHAKRSVDSTKLQVEGGILNQSRLFDEEAKLEKAQAALRTARTELLRAEIDLDDLTIRAPATGKILSIDVQVGEFANPEKPVIHLQVPIKTSPGAE